MKAMSIAKQCKTESAKKSVNIIFKHIKKFRFRLEKYNNIILRLHTNNLFF